jgi:hypothetical protein
MHRRADVVTNSDVRPTGRAPTTSGERALAPSFHALSGNAFGQLDTTCQGRLP